MAQRRSTTRGKAPTKPKAQAPASDFMDAQDVDWGDLLGDLGGQSGPVLFVKERTRVRLMPFRSRAEIFLPISTWFNGNERTKYLAPCQDLGSENPSLRYLLIPTKVARDIIALAQEGWDLFNPQAGHAIAVVKSGSGMNVSYAVSPSPKPVPIAPEVLEELMEADHFQVAEDFTEDQRRRSEERQGGGSADDEADDDHSEQDGNW